jgi:hypothetical protein
VSYLEALVARLRPEGAVAPLVRPADTPDLALGGVVGLEEDEEMRPADPGAVASPVTERAPGPEARRPGPSPTAPSAPTPRPASASDPVPAATRRSDPDRRPAAAEARAAARADGDDAPARRADPPDHGTPPADVRPRVERVERHTHTREVVRERVVEHHVDGPTPRPPAPLTAIVRPVALGPAASSGGRDGRGGPDPTSDAAPTVHVRIGRIVVHGDVARPAPARPAPAPVEHRSLADYLDSRDQS